MIHELKKCNIKQWSKIDIIVIGKLYVDWFSPLHFHVIKKILLPRILLS